MGIQLANYLRHTFATESIKNLQGNPSRKRFSGFLRFFWAIIYFHFDIFLIVSVIILYIDVFLKNIFLFKP